MRSLRSSQAWMVVVAMSVGLTASVVAQPDDEPVTLAAAYVTGSSVSTDEVAEDPAGEVGSVWDMEWSDPRLPSRMQLLHDQAGGLATHPDGVAMAMQMASAVRLDGADGDWVGTSWVLAWLWGSETDPEEEWVELVMLDGDGIYDGLSATLRSTGHGGVPGPYEGFIFEGGLPERPDLVEPSADRSVRDSSARD